MLITSLVVALSAAALTVNGGIAYRPTIATSADTEAAQPSKLRVISVTQERLEVDFYTPTGGIHILSEVRSGGEAVHVRVLITSTNGEPIFAADRPLDHSSSLLSIVGNEFLLVNETLDSGETKLTEYVVPPAYSFRVKHAMKRHRLTEKIFRHLDRETVNATGRSAIEELMTRPEVQFIIEAARALGSTGLHGVDNPAAMAFYTTTMRFAKAVQEGADANIVSSGRVPMEDVPSANRAKRFCRTYCDLVSRTCSTACICWRFVCGNCCWNARCYWHDSYGCRNGWSTIQCLTTWPGVACRV